ncbi:MAG: excisionase family DNA-binding protein [Propionibacteriaceae bacterium]|jgi:excisionase family DNA binding protein|nr:excisionase family DNA-binding protein [Propionibacteriaceae bacterium]
MRTPNHQSVQWLSLRDAADYTGTSIDTLRRRINDGQLTAYYMGRSHTVRIKASDLDGLMRPIRTVGTSGRSL